MHMSTFLIDDRLYSVILRSLEQTHCACMWFYMSDELFIARFLNIHQSGVLTALAWLVPHETAAVSAQVLYTPYNHAPCHFMHEFSEVDVKHWHMLIWTSHSTFHFLNYFKVSFFSELIESVRMMACVVWLSPLEAIQQRACVTTSWRNVVIVWLDQKLNWANVCSRTLLEVFGEAIWFLIGQTFLCEPSWKYSLKLYSGSKKLHSTCSGNIRPIQWTLPLIGWEQSSPVDQKK